MLVTGLDPLVVWEDVGAEAGAEAALLLGADTAELDGLAEADGALAGLLAGLLTELLDGLLTELLDGLLAGLLTELTEGLLDGLVDAELTSTRGRSLMRGVCVWTAAYAGPTTPRMPAVIATAAADRFMGSPWWG
jgi:hypothetical protein